MRRRELEKAIAREQAAELDLHEQWKDLINQLATIKAEADVRERETRAKMDALRYDAMHRFQTRPERCILTGL